MKIKIFVYILLTVLIAMGCHKSTPEASIVFTTDASTSNISTASSFNVNVTLTSAMPSQGIKISATVTDQTTSGAISQNAAITSSATKNQITLIGLPQQHWCSITVTVTSVATLSNTASQSFTVVYK
jgi:hypothetical protein